MPTEMQQSGHPAGLQEYWKDETSRNVARHLHVSRVTLSKFSIAARASGEMSLRLSAALGTHPSSGSIFNRPMNSLKPSARNPMNRTIQHRRNRQMVPQARIFVPGNPILCNQS